MTCCPSKPSNNAWAWVLSWVCPAVNRKRSGLPRPSTVIWILVLNPPRLRPNAWLSCPPLFLCACRTWMCPNYRAINHHVFHIRVAGKIRHHCFPDTIVAPARKTFVDAVPLPVFGGQQAPLRSAAAYPHHRFHEAATF